jgi:glutamyl-tRNA reductase
MGGLPQALAEADLALSSTGSPGLVLTEPLLREAIALRAPGRTLAIIDLALPRDVDPRARALPGIRLVDLDDLQAEVAGTLAERNQDIPQVEARIDAATAAFMRTLAQRRVAPTISKLHRWAEDLGRSELQRALRRMAELPEADRQTLEAMVTALVGKLIHPPIAELKGLGESEEAMARAVLMEQIFGLADASPEARA